MKKAHLKPEARGPEPLQVTFTCKDINVIAGHLNFFLRLQLILQPNRYKRPSVYNVTIHNR